MNNSFDHAAWTSWRRREVEKSGNDPTAWINVARNLVVSAAILVSTYTAALRIILRNVRAGGSEIDSPRTSEEEVTIRIGHQTHSVALMLFGFAVECLLKSVYLMRGGLLYRDGKYTNPKKLARSHNLVELSEALKCSDLFSEEQLDLLDLLSARNEMGRYPTHSRFEHYGIQPPAEDGTARFYGLWDSGKSTVLFDVLEVLYRELGEKTPIEADSLLEEGRVVRRSYSDRGGVD